MPTVLNPEVRPRGSRVSDFEYSRIIVADFRSPENGDRERESKSRNRCQSPN